MLKYYCDRCGKEMTNSHWSLYIEGGGPPAMYRLSDLCIDCSDKLKDWLKNLDNDS